MHIKFYTIWILFDTVSKVTKFESLKKLESSIRVWKSGKFRFFFSWETGYQIWTSIIQSKFSWRLQLYGIIIRKDILNNELFNKFEKKIKSSKRAL